MNEAALGIREIQRRGNWIHLHCECWVLDPLSRCPGQSGPSPQEAECNFLEFSLQYILVALILY